MNSNGRIGYQLKMYVHFVFKYWQFLYYLYDPRFGRDGWLTSNEVDNGWALVTLFAKPMIQHYGTWLPNDYIMRSHILPYLIICSSWIKQAFICVLFGYLRRILSIYFSMCSSFTCNDERLTFHCSVLSCQCFQFYFCSLLFIVIYIYICSFLSLEMFSVIFRR